MNIAVCIKQVPDTETIIKILPGDKEIETGEIKYILNPYDEFAVEEALKIKEQFGGDVDVYTLGPERVKEALKTCLAMGADKAFHLYHDSFKGSDSHSSALALSASIKKANYDLIFCGKEAIDDNCGQVGGAIAEMLKIPHISLVTNLELDIDNKTGTVIREIENGYEHIEFSFPALITCQKGLNNPRLPSLKGIMKARKKEIIIVTPDSLGLPADSVGEKAAKTKILNYFAPPQRPIGKFFNEDIKDSVKNIVKLLREEAKVI